VENLWKVDHVIRVEREDGVRDFLMRFTLTPHLYTASPRITVCNKLYRFSGGGDLEGS